MTDENTIEKQCTKCGAKEMLKGLEAWSALILGHKCPKCGYRNKRPGAIVKGG